MSIKGGWGGLRLMDFSSSQGLLTRKLQENIKFAMLARHQHQNHLCYNANSFLARQRQKNKQTNDDA